MFLFSFPFFVLKKYGMANWVENIIKRKGSFVDSIRHVPIMRFWHLKNGVFLRAGIWRINE